MKTDYRNFWFDIFNERHPDEVKEIMDGDIYKEWLNIDSRLACDEKIAFVLNNFNTYTMKPPEEHLREHGIDPDNLNEIINYVGRARLLLAMESYAKQHVIEFTLSQSPRTPIIMEAKEFYELKRMGLFTEDITSNPSPDYSLPFYQAIFVLMEDYAAQKCREREKEVVTEFQDFLLKNGYCDTDVYAEPPTAIDQFFSNK